MKRRLLVTKKASDQLCALADSAAKRGLHKQVLKTLALPQHNMRHPGLKTHHYTALRGDNGETVWEAYVQNNTPGAYRIFFHYGPDDVISGKRIPTITIVAVSPHP